MGRWCSLTLCNSCETYKKYRKNIALSNEYDKFIKVKGERSLAADERKNPLVFKVDAWRGYRYVGALNTFDFLES